MNLILIVTFLIICLVGIICVIDGIIIGIPASTKKKNYNKSYILKPKNRMDYQKSTECSGFSLAYVLRSYGIEANGNDVYAKIHGKMKNGAVMPGILVKAIRGYGCNACYVKGNLETIKSDLSEGKRVIVFIRTQLDKNWLHYASIVGYDDEYIYIAESMNSLVNCQEEKYNRKLTHQEFLKYWDTREIYMPFYRNTYIVVDK